MYKTFPLFMHPKHDFYRWIWISIISDCTSSDFPVSFSIKTATFRIIDFLTQSWKDDDMTYERMTIMNLSVKSTENVDYMIEAIKEKLKVLNLGAIKSSHFDEDMYIELKDIYDLVMRKNSFSPNEMQALVEELGHLRKQ